MSKTSTARTIDVVATASTDYVLGGKTQNAIAEFAAAFAESASIGAQCVVAALEVAADFPKWSKDSAAYKALGQGTLAALRETGMKDGSAKGYATHFSNIVRVAQLPEVTFSKGKRKGKEQMQSCSGREFFLKHCGNFTDAYRAAKTFAKQYGLTNGKGRKAGTGKVLDKGEIVDMLDKVINAARVNAEYAKTGLVQSLLAARKIATGERKQEIAERVAASTVARVHKASMSRGQKAAATRRANQIKAERVAQQARIVH